MGSMPSVRMASISSRIFMVPIWAVNAEAERPATMTAARMMPTSRSVRMPSMSMERCLRAETAELAGALLEDHAANQKADERDDRHRGQAGLLDLMDERGSAKFARDGR